MVKNDVGLRILEIIKRLKKSRISKRSRLVLIDPVRILRGPKYDGFSKIFHQFETISHLPFSVFSANCN